MKPFMIAEIGSNWRKHDDAQMNMDLAVRQICAAKKAGASAVKFQHFTALELWGPDCVGTVKEAEQNKYHLPIKWVEFLSLLCEQVGIEFMCSAFSVEGYKRVDPFVSRHKVASPEATDPEIMKYIISSDKQALISTGCLTSRDVMSMALMVKPYDVFMECVSEYPARECDYDLLTLRNLDKPWGISDHTQDYCLARRGRELGASYFETHVDFFTEEGGSTPDEDVSKFGVSFEVWVDEIKKTKVHNLDVIKAQAAGRYSREMTGFRPFNKG